jgi:serine/threonine protein kinase
MPKITPVKTPDPEGPTPVGAPDTLKPGKIFASFELERELEQGSTGAVWLAQDYSVGRGAEQVLLRFLPERLGSNKAAVEKLKEEIQRRSALNHANILHTYGVVESRGRVAIKMEYLDGQSLASSRLTRPNQVFEVRELEVWVKKMCQALAYAHQEVGLVHGDIVPGNLVIDRSGELKLRNFGIEDSIAASMGRAAAIHNVAEILPYRSPQRASGEEPAVTDDLYSLGATLYELLTGKPALYAGEIGDRASGKLPSVTERRVELGIEGDAIPQIWEETVAACLAKDPVERPQSAKEIEQRLVKEVSPEVPAKDGSKALPESAPKPPSPVRVLPVRMRWLVIAGVLFVLAFGSVLAFFLFHRATKLEREKVVLNTTPARTKDLPDGARSPAATVPPLLAESSTKKNPRPVPTPAAEPSLGASSTPAVEASPTVPSEVTPTPSAAVDPTSATNASPAPSPEIKATPSTQETATSTETASVSPPKPLSQPDAGATKEDVIRRINAMPGVTAAKKANLIEKMNKARSMERLVVIPFENGRSTLRRSAADELAKSFTTPEMRDRLSDPTIVLVVAGYADAGGRAEANLRISQARAENVSRILKEQAGLFNAMQTIGMGGTELLDSNRPDQNRAVEIWLVVPL